MEYMYTFTRSRKTVKREIACPGQAPATTAFRLAKAPTSRQNPYDCYDQELLKARRPVGQLPANALSIRAVDLMSGCGGLSLGALEACRALGRRFVAALAIDCAADCTNVFARNIPHEHVITDKVERQIDGTIGRRSTATEKAIRTQVGDVDLLLSGPPCQGYSDLNNHTRRSDQRNRLYERVARFVEVVRPNHVIIENVPTVIHGREYALRRTLQLLEAYQYSIDCGVVNLATIGVPQARRRHVVLASLSKSPSIQGALMPHLVERFRGVMWAIGDLRSEPQSTVFAKPSTQTSENVKRIRYLHQRDVYDLPDRLRPTCHRDRDHSYKSMYGRLHPRLPAQTMTSGFGSPGQGRFVHPTQPRTLTPHEAARIQFFPDFFDFSTVSRRTSLADMIGNAVPMKLSFALTLHLLT